MYNINSNVLTKSNASAGQLNSLVAGTHMAGTGNAFKEAENTHGINAIFMVAHAALESAWGGSNIAQTKNNLFGINAIDSNPNQADRFGSLAACIKYYAQWLKREYLTPGGDWYEGPTLHGIFVHYSSSHDTEARNIATIMNELASRINAKPSGQAATKSGLKSVYIVKPNDNLSVIAAKYGISLASLENANQQFAPNYNLIHPGDKVYIPAGKTSKTSTKKQAPVSRRRVYIVKSGDNLWTIAKRNKITLRRLERANPQFSANFDLIHPGDKVYIP